ncbi:MAG: VCBS repeat-containing protein [Bryobacterales bacterium]|nr:VCBS repeat-containing protein [Bryobacterales bacterium]
MRWLEVGGMPGRTTVFAAIATSLACFYSGLLVAQGMSRRGATAMPRPKPSGRMFPASFTDVASAAGLNVSQICGADQKKYIVESMGLGVAFLDYNNDGWPDVFLVNGSRIEPSAGPAPTNRLYRNNRDGTFTDVTVKAGLARSGWGQSVAVGDYDNDGFADLFITYWGQNVLYHNNGDETFTDDSARARVAGEGLRWGSGASFFDYDRDGLLDLFVANYLDLDLKRTPLPGSDPACA